MPKKKDTVPQPELSNQPKVVMPRDRGDERSLISEGGNDYVLKKGHRSAWITVDGISVYVVRGDEGVSVCLYSKGDEDGDSIAETWATFGEAEPEKKRRTLKC